METQHSPGPWHLRHAFGKYELSYDDDMIADMKMSGLPEDADNARLISAAPELLEALQLFVDTAENGGWPSAALVIARAAIAKAVGPNA